ncbi:MAG TPA: class I SAM-dependent methyltransferase [Pyrinomonadaceae bacterium]|nr:class I SAM-dependent methyltransferase [Pyrinomonadaceae bacterium]
MSTDISCQKLSATHICCTLESGPFYKGFVTAPGLHCAHAVTSLASTIKRRFKRARRRRKVGRAYDMALEVASVLPPRADVLDVGCGNGFIAHHLQSMLGKTVVGLDVGTNTADARINYLPYDGRHFPVRDDSFDAVLLCYVLHHAQDPVLVLNEVTRVLRDGGLAIIYEDIPAIWWDRAVCWTHDRQWRSRTGPCTFQREQDWRRTFSLAGFDVVKERALSRWRNLAHPVSRRFFVIKTSSHAKTQKLKDHPAPELAFAPLFNLNDSALH